MRLAALHNDFVGEITGIDMTARGSDIPADAFRSAMDQFPVCCIRNDTAPSDEDHIAFSRAIGPLDRMPKVGRMVVQKPLSPYPEIIDGASNIDADGNLIPEDDFRLVYARGNLMWHTDASFKIPRAVYSFLLARIVPPAGGDTEFADMRAAYDALPASLQARIETLEADHSIWHSRVLAGYPEPTAEERASRPSVRNPLVRVHPETGRKALYIASHIERIVGLPEDESQALLDELMERATAPEFVYRHKWRVGDLVVWDNRCTMHRATPMTGPRFPRDMRRTVALEAALAD